MALRIELEEEAESDLREGARYYREKVGPELAMRFLASIREQLELIATQPDMGRDYSELALREELRSLQWFPVRDFPYLIFWTHDATSLFVWAVPHAHSDLPERLRERLE